LQLIEESGEHSNTIISDLLEYSREIRLELTKTDAKSLTKDALPLAKIPRRIRVVDLTKKEPRVEADADETILRPRPNRAQPRATASPVRLSVYL
jgi:signal transduction histidine kinase